jgi:SAM-dependent MidA family methyltransferase
VDFTSIRTAAEEAGLQTLGFLDQTYFLFGLLSALGTDQPISSQQSINNQQSTISNLQSISNQQSAISNLKMLIMPGGLGSTFKVMILGKGVGTPALAGCSYRMRVT